MDRSWMVFQHPTYLAYGIFLCLVLGLAGGTAAAVAAKSIPLGVVMFVAISAFIGMVYFTWGAYD